MKTAIVTGADGFIGSALCKKLLCNGTKVYAIVSDSTRVRDKAENLILIESDMTDYTHKIFHSVKEKIDVFYHLAWRGVSGKAIKEHEVQAKNLSDTIQLCDLLKKIEVGKLIFFSTSHVARVLKRDRNIVTCIYGAGKFASDNYLRTFCFKESIGYHSILFVNVFGVGDYSARSTNVIIRKMKNNEDIDLIDGEVLYDWTYIDDAINGVLYVSEKGQDYYSYYISSFGPRKFRQIIEEAKEAIHSNSTLRFNSFQEDSMIDFEKINDLAIPLVMHNGQGMKSDFEKFIKKTSQWLDDSKESFGIK